MQANKIKQVTVTVNEAGQPVCTPNNAVIKGSNVLIAFQLQASGYAFPGNDAVVVTDGGEQFPYDCWTVGANSVALFDANTAVGTYAYTVSVVEVGTGRIVRLDPAIRNEA